MENILVRQSNEAGLQKLLGIVARAGLLATPPEYPDRHNVADAPNTVTSGPWYATSSPLPERKADVGRGSKGEA